MFENNVYNLMAQAVQESKSLWRIANDYREDAEAAGDEELAAFWDQLATEKAAHVEQLEALATARRAAGGEATTAEANPAPDVPPQA